MKRRQRKTALSFAVVLVFAIAVSCREPTQITVVIKTGEKCSDLSGVEIVVGPDQAQTQARFEQQYNAAVTHDCDVNGAVGTLVITPGGHGGTLVVATGVRAGGAPAPDPTTCANADSAKSCIIARRSFSFLSHTPLTLPIELDPLCVGKSCDPASTCFKGGCVPATVVCANNECGLPQENPGQGTGGGNEGGSSDGAYDDVLDAMSFDDVAMPDGASDAATIVEGGPDAEAGVDASGEYPLCNTQGGGVSCCPACAGSNGTPTMGACDPLGDPNGTCCHCQCTGSSKVVTCDLGSFMFPAASCGPTMMCP